MKWIVPLLFVACTLPFMFNSCGQFHSAGSAASLQTSSCKHMLENGRVTAVRANDQISLFAARKVILGPQDSKTAVREQGSPEIPAGSSLSVILDNTCVAKETPPSALVAAVMNGRSPHPELIRQAYTYVVPASFTQYALEKQASSDPCILGISWNNIYHAQQVIPSPTPSGTMALTLNDPMLAQQTHLNAINALTAFTYFYGSTYGMPMGGGTPVKIAILDTGIDYNHPDLQGNIWSFSQGWGLDVTAGASNPYDPMDISPIGHGTHLSGIVGAVSNNGIGIAGTMPFNGKIMAIKIFSSDGNGGVQTTTTDFFNGLQAAILNSADVVNLSVATDTTDYDAVAQEGIQGLLAQGIVTAVAVGNGSPNGQLIDGTVVHVMPAMLSTYAGVIGVAAYDSNTGNISSFSNYSTTYAEIAAPGENSSATGIFSTLPINMSSYGALSGTSQATPMVAAAAALTIGWIRDSYGMAPSPAEVEQLITASSFTNPQLGQYVRNGNQLDLLNLALTIMQQYPGTNGGSKVMPTGTTCY